MIGDKNSSVILGEASESEDEEGQNNYSNSRPNVSKAIVAGEASESENESEDEPNIAKDAFKSKVEDLQNDSLLHRKLRESNFKLQEDLTKLITHTFKSAADQVNDINQSLLKNQIEIQETLKYFKRSSVSSDKLENIFSSVLSQNCVPTIHFN